MGSHDDRTGDVREQEEGRYGPKPTRYIEVDFVSFGPRMSTTTP
jgi:hypothetical protein